jgi:ubiquinone/menaquinone biosynthesis C-methylase UbiE
VKLHLGCGKRILDGWINCDLHKAEGIQTMDIRHLPFDDQSADEILAVHVCEHFYKHDLPKVLREWHRVLKPNGKIALELPCLDRVLQHFMNGSGENMTLWALYGDPSTHKDGEPSLHKWCWSKNAFKEQLENAGFKDISEEVPHYHQPSRDMRFTASK